MEDNAQRQIVVALVAIAVVVIGATAVLLILARSNDDTEATVENTVQGNASTFSASLRWEEVAGYYLPISSEHGPTNATDGIASLFKQTPEGAALAASHHIFNLSGSAPESFRDNALQRVLANPASADFEKATRNSPELPVLAGWTVINYSPSGTQIGLFYDDSTLRYFEVSLVWHNDDWKLLDPSWNNLVSSAENPNSPNVKFRNHNPAFKEPKEQSSTTLAEEFAGDGAPPTEEDFATVTTQPAPVSQEEALQAFAQQYFAKDYRLNHDEQVKSLKNHTTPEFYIELLENRPDAFFVREATRLEEVITVTGQTRVNQATPESYQILTIITITTTEGTVSRETSVIVEIDDKNKVKNILVGP